jgi:hypothetical protein
MTTPFAPQVLDEMDHMLNVSGLAASDQISFVGLKTRIAALLVRAAAGADVDRPVAALAREVARHLPPADAAKLRTAASQGLSGDGTVVPLRPGRDES